MPLNTGNRKYCTYYISGSLNKLSLCKITSCVESHSGLSYVTNYYVSRPGLKEADCFYIWVLTFESTCIINMKRKSSSLTQKATQTCMHTFGTSKTENCKCTIAPLWTLKVIFHRHLSLSTEWYSKGEKSQGSMTVSPVLCEIHWYQ